jgi:hypothetical protein
MYQNDECKQWPGLTFFLKLFCLANTCICTLVLFFFPGERQEKKMEWECNSATVVKRALDWLKTSFFFFSILLPSLSFPFLHSFMFCFLAFSSIHSFISFFFSPARLSRVFYIVKKRIKVWAGRLFFLCISFVFVK